MMIFFSRNIPPHLWVIGEKSGYAYIIARTMGYDDIAHRTGKHHVLTE